MDLSRIREELCQMRRQILRQRKEIRNLELAGIPTGDAEEFLARMKSRVAALRDERARQAEEQRRQDPALAKVRRRPFERR
jgi:hypothetical protein